MGHGISGSSTWRAGNDEAAGRGAWHQLVERFDRPRAAWIARALTPMNIDDLPEQPVPETEPLRGWDDQVS